MANSGQLAGLAALGALGIMYDRMNRKQDGSKVPVEDRSTYPAGMGPTAPTPPIDDESQWGTQTAGQREYAASVNPDDESQWGTPGPGQAGYKKPVRRPPASSATTPMGSSQGRPGYAQRPVMLNDPRLARDFSPDTSGPGYPQRPVMANDPRLAMDYAPDTTFMGQNSSQGRRGTGVRQTQGADYGIPGQSVQAPQGGERADSTELGRNVTNALGAMGAAGRLSGIGNMATEAATAGRVQRAYNAQQEARRAAEGLNPAEVAAFKKKLAEASFEGGMKKGGKVKTKAKAKVKKMASGGMTSRPNASKRADGIATKGHTKCKMR